MDTVRKTYIAYLVRLWRVKESAEGEGIGAWRASLESPQTGERIGFGSVEELFTYLRQEMEENMTRLISAVLAVLVVVSAFLVAPAAAKPPAAVTGDIDFAVPTWGLKHGWMHLDVPGPTTVNGRLTGIVRWVEVNDNLEVRYVRATPTCLSFNADGTSAVMTVQIQERLGWGDGAAGQYVNFWLHDGGTPGTGRDQFATPFWPPQDSVPGCTYAEASENVITAAAGNFTIRN